VVPGRHADGPVGAASATSVLNGGIFNVLSGGTDSGAVVSAGGLGYQVYTSFRSRTRRFNVPQNPQNSENFFAPSPVCVLV